MKLYEISKAMLDVIERGFSIDPDTGEILFDSEDLDKLESMRADKIESCAKYVKSLESEAKAIRDECDRLQERMRTKSKKAERIREYVLRDMASHGDSRLETAAVDVRVRKSAYVDVSDLDAIPGEYVKEKVTKTPDKVAIRKAISAGEQVEGASLMTRESVTIR